MSRVRALCSSTVSLTGVVVLAVMVGHVATTSTPLAGLLLAAFGGLIALTLVALGYVVYRLEFTARQTVRIAGWNVLGIVVIGAALALVYAYQGAVDAVPVSPVFSGTVIVAISSFAHALIGINDARRIRATELARERRKLTVLSRLVRHDLRTISQYLHGYATRAERADTDEERASLADDVRETADDLGALHDHLRTLRELVETDAADAAPVDVVALVEDAVVDVRADHDATIAVNAPDSAMALGGEHVADAVYELVENAVVHTDGSVTVRVSGDAESVTVAVSDEGPGVPPGEREVVTGETEVTQLRHASGVGLWVAKWVADAYGGTLDFDDATVSLRFPAA